MNGREWNNPWQKKPKYKITKVEKDYEISRNRKS